MAAIRTVPANQTAVTNNKHVVSGPYPRSVDGYGPAGTSATEGYRREVAARRRALARCTLFAGAAALAGWLAWVSAGMTRTAALAAAGTAGIVALAARPRPDPQRWLRGAAGEAATAGLLEGLPERKWAVLHDLRVPGSRSNVDHLVIGPTGVWAVDTKTTRGRVSWSLFRVRFGSRPLDTGPARWEAEVLSDRLGVRVRPVVAVHGEGTLPRRGVRRSGVRVVLAADLVPRLRRGRRRLRRSEVRDLARLASETFEPAGSTRRRGFPAEWRPDGGRRRDG